MHAAQRGSRDDWSGDARCRSISTASSSLDRTDASPAFKRSRRPEPSAAKLVNTGIYVFSPQIFDRIPANTFYDFGKQVFPELLRDGLPFYGFDARGAYWCDIGTPGEYRRASDDVVNGVFAHSRTRARTVRIRARAFRRECIDRSATCGSARMRVSANAYASLGRRSSATEPSSKTDAIVEASIVWEESTIGAGAHLRGAIVGKDTQVNAGSEITEDIVAVAAV